MDKLPTTAKNNSRGLGKGLSAIFGEMKLEAETGFIPNLPVTDIVPNPAQPRTTFNPEELVSLADSIREYGIIEPLIVSKLAEEGKYQLVAGERRWRAAKLAQVNNVPVIVKEVSSQQLLELAIIENLQRKDLNPLEEATALSELYSKFRVKLEDLSKKTGRDISTISNKMRLLKLPTKVKQGLLNEEIAESHAYVLLSLKSEDALLAAYNIIVRKKLSVSQADALVKRISLANKDAIPQSTKQNAIIYDEKTANIENKLQTTLGKGFRLIRKRNGGRVVIPFRSDEQLDALTEFLLSKDFGPESN